MFILMINLLKGILEYFDPNSQNEKCTYKSNRKYRCKNKKKKKKKKSKTSKKKTPLKEETDIVPISKKDETLSVDMILQIVNAWECVISEQHKNLYLERPSERLLELIGIDPIES